MTTPDVTAPVAEPPDDAALLDATLKKTELIWVGPDPDHTRPVWFLWSDGAVYLMTGGGEQTAPVEPGATAVVIARSKDKGVRLVSFTADVTQVTAGETWEQIAGQMQGKRLNSPDGDAALQRWARDATLLELGPRLPLLEAPGRYDSRSHAAKPAPTSAGTKVPRPWHLFGRPQRNR